MSETTDPTAGERELVERCRHGEPEGECPSCAACDACEGECGVCPYAVRPAEPDAGDVEALDRVKWCICPDYGPIAEGDTHTAWCSDQWRRLTAVLDAVRRKAGDERAEQIAQTIDRAARRTFTNEQEAAMRDAARIARESR